MDIRDYEYIVAIAEQGSISRAAALLFITQSALTKFLQRTEKVLGIALFTRNGNQFLLTEAGRQYVETGRQIMHLDRQLTGRLEMELAVQKKQIRLGYGMGRTNYILQEILPAFYQRYPDIKVYTKADTGRKQMLALEQDNLDLALVANTEQKPGYRYLPVEKSYIVLAVHKASPLVDKAKSLAGYPYPVIGRGELEALPCVSLPPTTSSGNLTQELLRKYDIHMNNILELSDVRSLIDAVEYGLGSAIFLSVPIEDKKITYLSIEGVDTLEQTSVLVLKSDKNLSPAMKYMIELITKRSFV